jgi:hypothetical protein
MKRSRKILVALGVGVGSLAIASAAFAYFTGGTASDTKTGHVGSTTTWTISVGAFSGGPVYPGAGTDSAGYTITNSGSGAQALTSVTAAVASNSGNITQSGTPLVGCLASWFSAVAGAPTPATGVGIAPSGTATGTVNVTMSDSGTNQNICKSATPDVTVTAA